MKASVLLACALAVAGCNSPPRLSVEPAPTTSASNGSPAVRLAVGQMRLPERSTPLPTLLITATNTTGSDIAFGPANVTIAADGRAVRTYSQAELAADIRRQADFRSYAAQTRAEVQAQVIEQDVVPTANPSAIELRARGLQEAAAANSTARRALESLNDVLTPQVLKPGEMIARRVVLRAEDLRGATSIAVHIQLGSEDFPFTVHLAR